MKKKTKSKIRDYLSNPNNTEYPTRELHDSFIDIGTNKRSRLVHTGDNVVYFAADEIQNTTLPVVADMKEFDKYLSLTDDEQLSILLHILRIQAYAMRKAIDVKSSISLPYIGRFVYNKYKELSYNIHMKLKDIENVENIKYLARTIITDLNRSERRIKRRDRLASRLDSPIINLADSGIKKDIIDDRYNDFSR